MSSSSNPPFIGPGGNSVKFFTANRFLDRSDKEVGSVIAGLDKTAKEAIQVGEKMCPGLQEQTAALAQLDTVGNKYVELLDDLEKGKVDKESNIYTSVERSMNDTIYYKAKLAADIQDCINRKVYNDLGQAIVTNSQAESNRTGAADTKEDLVIREKIRRSKLVKICGFRSFSDYAGGVEYKRFFDDYMTAPFILKNYGADIKGTLGTLLFGPPGTGKTLLAEAVAEELRVSGFNSSVYTITSSTIKGKYVGESEKSITFLFEEARASTNNGKDPVVIFIDEVDGLLDEKSGGGTGLLSQINAEMEGLSNTSNKGIIVIIATNFPEVIPKSAAARFTNQIYVGLPNRDDVREILVNTLEAKGDSRYDLVGVPIDSEEEDPADEHKPVSEKKIRPKRTMTMTTLIQMGKDAGYKADMLDVLAEAISQKRFSPREIESLFKYINGIVWGAARDFYKDPIPKGSKVSNGKQYIEEQYWIWDKTTFRHKVVSKDGKSCSETQQEKKDIIIPIGFAPEETAIPGVPGTLGQTITTNGRHYFEKTMPKPGKEKERWVIVTSRKLVGEGANQHWEYRMIKQEKEEDSIQFSSINVPFPNEKMLAMLGSTQITMQHFEDALNAIKPVRINNARKLLAYAMSPGRTIEKIYARGFDLQMLSDLAREEDENERNGLGDGVGDLQKLFDQVKLKIKSYDDPSFKEFTWEKWMAENASFRNSIA
jgi:SpoVK/Ycf46/Vps4 family AAA+-type ATPase